MHRSFLRRVISPLLVLLVVLGLFWLVLPRLLGTAAERWLEVPGLNVERLDIVSVGGSQVRLREFRGVFRAAGGQGWRIALHNVVIDYSILRRRIDRLDIARAELIVLPDGAQTAQPWPRLDWPQFPVSAVRIGEFQVMVRWSDRPPFTAKGGLLLQQDADRRLLAEFQSVLGRLRLTAIPGATVESRLEWQPATGPAAAATLRIGQKPDQQPLSLSAHAPLAVLLGLGQALGFPLPVDEVGGEITAQADVELGEFSGDLRAVVGEAGLARLTARIGTETPLMAGLAGKIRLIWQGAGAGKPGQGRIELQPGLAWQLTRGGAETLAVTGRVERLFALRLDAAGATSGADLPFTISSRQWGRWEGAVTQLQLKSGTGAIGLDRAEARVGFKGRLPRWQKGAMQVRVLQAGGKAELRWQRDAGFDGDTRLQVGVEQVQVAGVLIRKPQSTMQLRAGLKTGALAKDLELHGEISSNRLQIERGNATPATLGPARVRIVRFRPLTQQGEFEVGADAVRVGGWPAAALRSRLRLDGSRLEAGGEVHWQHAPVLQFSATHALDRGCGGAQVTVSQKLTALGQALQPRPPALRPLDLQSGQLDGRFDLDWCLQARRALDVRGRLQALGVDLGWEKARLQGADLILQLDALQPLQGRIQLAARSGLLATGTALADFRLEAALAAKEMRIDAFDLHLLGGKVHLAPQSLLWPLDGQTVTLEIRNFDLGQALALFKQPGLSGSGRLGGSLPLTYREGSLEVRDGQLDSLGEGWLKYAPTHAMPDNPGLQVLRNLHFKQLGMHLWYAPGGAYRAQIRLDGSNPDFYSGYPVRFGLNLNGELPGLFRAALFSGDFNRHILEQLQSGNLQ